jgi:hypothetical protein
VTTYCTLYCRGGRGGQNDDLLPSTQQVDYLAYLLGSRGHCLLPSIFGKVEVQGTIFDFAYSKKFDLSLLTTLGRVLDRCRTFDLFASVDAHLCLGGTLHEMPTGPFWEDSGTYPPETMAVSCTPGGLFQKSMHAAEGSGILKRLYAEKHRFFPKNCENTFRKRCRLPLTACSTELNMILSLKKGNRMKRLY